MLDTSGRVESFGSAPRAKNLTNFEIEALTSGLNLADGHPRQTPTPTQQAIIRSIPKLFTSVEATPFQDVEHSAQHAFMAAMGQLSAPIGDLRVRSLYSSSVAISALGYVLGERRDKVALLHPTFDNIPDLMRRHVELVPLDEAVEAGDLAKRAHASGATAVFLTTPNNPTGRILQRDDLELIAEGCAARGLTLCLDTSFRGYDRRVQYDHYEVLESAGVDYAVIEDTGKLWPMMELKIGFLAFSRSLRSDVDRVVSEILLSVSPVVLALVEALALDLARGGMEDLHRLVAGNRRRLEAMSATLPGVSLPDADSRISVARIRFESAEIAENTRLGLQGRGVQLLPCAAFHWARTCADTDLRIALSRDPAVVDAGLAALRGVVEPAAHERLGRVTALDVSREKA